MLQKAYNRITAYATHPYAMWILGGLAFTESFISPIPPDVLLIPMMIQNRRQALAIALVCTLTSVMGGALGYWIGYSLYDLVGHYIVNPDTLNHYQDHFTVATFLLISLKGFLPIPFKIVAILAGLMQYDFTLFMLASLIARSSRFIMLAALIYVYGEPIKTFIEKNLRFVMISTALFIIGTLLIAKFL